MFGRISKTAKIFVVDNQLEYSLQEALFNFCRNSKFTFGHSASSISQKDLSRFVSHLTEEELKLTSLDTLFKSLTKKYFNKSVRIDRSYINVYFPSTPTGVHSDDDDVNAVSFLAFLNPQWMVDWGGETVFYSDNLQKIVDYVIPRGDRVVLFNSNIPHSARSPSILCEIPRFTLTIKGFLE